MDFTAQLYEPLGPDSPNPVIGHDKDGGPVYSNEFLDVAEQTYYQNLEAEVEMLQREQAAKAEAEAGQEDGGDVKDAEGAFEEDEEAEYCVQYCVLTACAFYMLLDLEQ